MNNNTNLPVLFYDVLFSPSLWPRGFAGSKRTGQVNIIAIIFDIKAKIQRSNRAILPIMPFSGFISAVVSNLKMEGLQLLHKSFRFDLTPVIQSIIPPLNVS